MKLLFIYDPADEPCDYCENSEPSSHIVRLDGTDIGRTCPNHLDNWKHWEVRKQ
jgi:hypothetical protein